MIDQVRTGTTPRLNKTRAAASPGPSADAKAQVMPASATKETGEEQRSFGQWHHGAMGLPSFDDAATEQHDGSETSSDGFAAVMEGQAEPDEDDAAVIPVLANPEDGIGDPAALPMPRSVADGLKRLMEEATHGVFAGPAEAGRSGEDTPEADRSAGLFGKAADAYGLRKEMRGPDTGLRPGMVFSSKF